MIVLRFLYIEFCGIGNSGLLSNVHTWESRDVFMIIPRFLYTESCGIGSFSYYQMGIYGRVMIIPRFVLVVLVIIKWESREPL